MQYQHKNHHAITYNGETKTPNEWARDPRVKVSNATIVRRKNKGASDAEALFGAKKTHTGIPYVDKRPPKTQFKHQRSNAITLTIRGIKKTATEWSREPGCKVCDGTIRARLRLGWDHELAVFEPPRSTAKKFAA